MSPFALAFLALLLDGSAAAPPAPGATATRPVAPAPDLLVTSRFTDEVLRYDGETGDFLGVFASGPALKNPVGLTFGPDGDLYVACANNDRVLRYDGVTGESRGAFVKGGRLSSPRNLNFGPGGDLFVANAGTNQVLRYEGRSGAFLGVAAGGGNLQGPTSFTFGPDGLLYVVSVLTNRVKRYDPATGAYLGNFVTENLAGPHDVAFGPDGRLYVTNASSTRIRAYDPQTGAFQSNYVRDAALTSPLGMSWDGRGHFYVSNQGRNEVRRYHAVTGAFLDSFVVPRSGGLSAPLFHAFVPDRGGPRLYPVRPGYAGPTNFITVGGLRPGERVLLLAGPGSASISLAACPNALLEIASPTLLALLVADESGRAVFGAPVPPAVRGLRTRLQAIGPATCTATRVVEVGF